jgi:hypothetical protein
VCWCYIAQFDMHCRAAPVSLLTDRFCSLHDMRRVSLHMFHLTLSTSVIMFAAFALRDLPTTVPTNNWHLSIGNRGPCRPEHSSNNADNCEQHAIPMSAIKSSNLRCALRSPSMQCNAFSAVIRWVLIVGCAL